MKIHSHSAIPWFLRMVALTLFGVCVYQIRSLPEVVEVRTPPFSLRYVSSTNSQEWAKSTAYEIWCTAYEAEKLRGSDLPPLHPRAILEGARLSFDSATELVIASAVRTEYDDNYQGWNEKFRLMKPLRDLNRTLKHAYLERAMWDQKNPEKLPVRYGETTLGVCVRDRTPKLIQLYNAVVEGVLPK